MEFWITKHGATTRAFANEVLARNYAIAILTEGEMRPAHLEGDEGEIHVYYTHRDIAVVKPLELEDATTDHGHIIAIAGDQS